MSGQSKNERRFLGVLRKADDEGWVMLYAAMAEKAEAAAHYPNGVYKRAIKRFRIAQAEHPEFSELYESWIQYIRREWLRKADADCKREAAPVLEHQSGEVEKDLTEPVSTSIITKMTGGCQG